MPHDNVLSTARTLPFSPEAVYAAFACGPVLAAWWGPEGFTNTFDTFDFSVGGKWIFTMHGPDGKHYANTSFFERLEPASSRIVIRHDCPPFFTLTVGLTPVAGGTHLTWDQAFDDAQTARAVSAVVGTANEQNLDRLTAVLRNVGAAAPPSRPTPPPHDVPSPINLQAAAEARAWADAANQVRPWRTTFFQAIAAAMDPTRPVRVLELGSGPGFLAEHVLARCPLAEMVLLDFSQPMHDLAQARLQPYGQRVQQVLRSFKDEHWPEGLGRFDYVVTNQAVHELRHKRHAQPLHRQVRSVLLPGGQYLVSDHYFGDDGMQKEGLYMTVEEQRQALAAAGFTQAVELLRLGGMVLHSAT